MRLTRAVIAFLCLGAAVPAPAQSQHYVISTYAGGPQPPSANTSTLYTGAVATDASGNVYFAGVYYGTDNPCWCVFKLDLNGVVTRIAGSSQRGFSGDGGLATSAQLSFPVGLTVDGAGNLFIADASSTVYGEFPWGFSNDHIRKVSPNGIITTVAGGGSLAGSAADGGPASSAQLWYVAGVAVDGAGNLLFSESVDDWSGLGSNRIRKVSPDGTITTVVGNGMYGSSGDGGPATSAQLDGPGRLAIDSSGNLFFVDVYNQLIRRVSPYGIITTVVDASASISAEDYCYCSVIGLTLDKAGNVFFTGDTVSKRSPDGVITTIVEANAGLGKRLVAVDGAGNLLLSGSNLLKLSPDGFITTLAGNGACCYSGDGGPATNAQMQQINSVSADSAGDLYIADTGNHRIRKVDPGGIISTAAGNGTWNLNCDALSGQPGLATATPLCSPSQVAVDGAGNLFIVDRNRIRKVSPDGTIASVAGDGTIGLSADGGPATQAQLSYPNSIAVDGAGNLYFAEWSRVRKISLDGIITTVAGTSARYSNSAGCSPPASPACGPPPVGDGQPATSVQLFGPQSVTVDGAGNLYFVDGLRVRKVSPDGIITTVVGNGGRAGYLLPTGDGGLATNASLWNPNGVTLDSAGDLYISEPVRIRKVTTDGIINTIAGSDNPGYSGDGGPATSAQLWNPTGLTVDGAGNVYVADSYNNVVRVLTPAQ